MPYSRCRIIISFLVILLASVAVSGPVPIPKHMDNAIEEDDGILLLVPTLPVDKNERPTKREVDYELITIPGDLIRNTVKEVKETYSNRRGPLPSSSKRETSNSLGSILISDLISDDNEEILIKRAISRSYSDPSSDENDDAKLSADLSKILSSLASVGLQQVSTGSQIASKTKDLLTSATAAGSNALDQGAKAVRWVVRTKKNGMQNFAEFAGNGFLYVGRLTSALAKILLKIPGLKLRLASDIIKAGQPFAKTLSEVISESADNMSDMFNAQSGLLKDTLGVLVGFIKNILKLKGRIIASFRKTGGGGTKLLSSGIKVGSAFVQSAGDVANAVGRSVGDLVEIVSDANVPKAPQLPKIEFPRLPKIVFETDDDSSGYKAPSAGYQSPNTEKNPLEELLLSL